MLSEPSINSNEIRTKIEEIYGKSVINLTSVREGETSWGYKVETQNNEIFFFKIYASLEDYKLRFDLIFKLFNNCGIRNITHPIKTHKGEYVIHLDKYPVALFNFISGFNASEKPLNEKERFRLGELIGRIHKAKDTLDFQLMEDFIYGNTKRLLETLENASLYIHDESQYRRKVALLLIENKEKLLNHLHILEEQGYKLRSQQLDFVICHGEPHQWNTMVNEQGEIFLVDWDDSLLAPKEKDLIFIKNDTIKLEGYRSIIGDFKLNEDVLHFYDLEWSISEIDVWSSKLLFGVANDIQNQHDLEVFNSVLENLNKN